jgi:hypothetical protein
VHLFSNYSGAQSLALEWLRIGNFRPARAALVRRPLREPESRTRFDRELLGQDQRDTALVSELRIGQVRNQTYQDDLAELGGSLVHSALTQS